MTDRSAARENRQQSSTPETARHQPSETSKAEVVAIVRRSRSSFQTGMRLLTPKRRMAMYAVYAFCRIIDDIADGTETDEIKIAQLTSWEREIAAVYGASTASSSLHPIADVLRWAVAEYDLPQAELEAVIAGMRWDVERPSIAPSMDDLMLYARHVAGAVGVLSVRIFGCVHPDRDRFALVLGEALQITNVLRDVDEDAAVGRVYVPSPYLQGQGVIESGVVSLDASTIVAHEKFPAACDDLAVLACERFAEARNLAFRIRSPRLAPAMVMMAVYSDVLASLATRGWTSPRQPLVSSRPRKAALAIRAAALGWRWPSLT
jgi:phytoene/squalene synthetase